MRGGAEHMLHLQVSHLKIPIHYIVYGKITPFTEHYASLLCNLFLCELGRSDDIVWMCLQGDCTQKVQAAGVFFVFFAAFYSLYNPLLIDRVYIWFARQRMQSMLSTTWWLMNCLLKKWINHELYVFCIFCMDTCMHWDELK